MQIWELLDGYENAHGRYDVKRVSDRGKAEGKALTMREPTTQLLWDNHIAGQGAGLGIIPLRSDDTLLWAALDIDVNNIDHSALETKVNELKLPLVVARSKSGGAHCFIFFNEPAPANVVVAALKSWSSLLGYGGCEVFPKQVSRYDDNDIGNWLNMPYYNADKTLRYGIKGGVQLSLNDFVEYGAEKRISVDQLHLLKTKGSANPKINTGLFTEGPPCLQVLFANNGFPEGTRNDGMYNVAVYLRKRFPDDWEDKIQEYNIKVCNPPLNLNEVNTTVKSMRRKDYHYRCRLAPISAHCDRTLCQNRDFGVGEAIEGRGRPEIGNLTKYVGDPVLWFFDINTQRVMVTTEELLNQTKLKQKVADAINRVMVSVPQPRWDRYIDGKMRDCDVIEVPLDATPFGQFSLLLDRYLTGSSQATSIEELVYNMSPYKPESDEVWFRSRGLIDFLNLHKFTFKSEHHIWQMLRKLGAVNKFVNVESKGFNVWVLPHTGNANHDAPLPDYKEKESF